MKITCLIVVLVLALDCPHVEAAGDCVVKDENKITGGCISSSAIVELIEKKFILDIGVYGDKVSTENTIKMSFGACSVDIAVSYGPSDKIVIFKIGKITYGEKMKIEGSESAMTFINNNNDRTGVSNSCKIDYQPAGNKYHVKFNVVFGTEDSNIFVKFDSATKLVDVKSANNIGVALIVILICFFVTVAIILSVVVVVCVCPCCKRFREFVKRTFKNLRCCGKETNPDLLHSTKKKKPYSKDLQEESSVAPAEMPLDITQKDRAKSIVGRPAFKTSRTQQSTDLNEIAQTQSFVESSKLAPTQSLTVRDISKMQTDLKRYKAYSGLLKHRVDDKNKTIRGLEGEIGYLRGVSDLHEQQGEKKDMALANRNLIIFGQKEAAETRDAQISEQDKIIEERNAELAEKDAEHAALIEKHMIAKEKLIKQQKELDQVRAELARNKAKMASCGRSCFSCRKNGKMCEECKRTKATIESLSIKSTQPSNSIPSITCSKESCTETKAAATASAKEFAPRTTSKRAKHDRRSAKAKK